MPSNGLTWKSALNDFPSSKSTNIKFKGFLLPEVVVEKLGVQWMWRVNFTMFTTTFYESMDYQQILEGIQRFYKMEKVL